MAADSLEQLYRKEQKSLRSLAWMILGDRAGAEDAVQECFTRLGLRTLSDIDNPAAYLRTSVVNECRSMLRSRKRFGRFSSAPEGLHLESHLSEFHDALLKLSPRRRTAVVLRYWCDLPVVEIASLMGSRPSTVSSLLNRALRDLREVI